MLQAHIYISGFVQGVGFRYFIRDNAEKLGIKGWVRNTLDNRVEAVLQGDKISIEKLIDVCNKGPILSEVKEIDVVWEDESENYSGFQINQSE